MGFEEMMNAIYTITLSDGSQITDLHLNGNNFISQNKITKEMFEGKLSHVTIASEYYAEEHENMELVQITQYNGEYWFVLVEIPESEMRIRKLISNMDYLAMMTDVDI